MAQLDNSLKYKLERLFGMSTGYVMDFTNATFSDFVQTSINVEPYGLYDGSKANILRGLWQDRSNAEIRKLTVDMLERWRTERWANDDDGTSGEWKIFSEAFKEAESLPDNTPSSADLEFLEQDYEIDVSKLQVELSMKHVIDQRLAEIEKCMSINAPLAAVFLCGSTLEGLLSDTASKNIEAFNRCRAAPKDRNGRVRPLVDWTLENLITTARELRVVGEDVAKHAHAVKDFRNYIHPRQQIKENFAPREFTAAIAQKVLYAAISDLSQGT